MKYRMAKLTRREINMVLKRGVFLLNYVVKFTLLVNIFVPIKLVQEGLMKLPFLNRLDAYFNLFALKVYARLHNISKFNDYPYSVSMFTVLDLAMKNLRYKRSRAYVTIMGTSLGIATIVFLVSLGFGVQDLIIDRAINLDEMRQADINKQPGSNLNITDETISQFESIENVDNVYPIIALVGKMEFNDSVSDVAVYGVENGYLKDSAISPIEGALFSEKESSSLSPTTLSDVLGTSMSTVEDQKYMTEITFRSKEDRWIKIRRGPDPTSELIGWSNGAHIGFEKGTIVSGVEYISGGVSSSDWIYAYLPYWDKGHCVDTPDICFDSIYKKEVDFSGNQLSQWGYIESYGFELIDSVDEGNVLGAEDRVEDVEVEIIDLAESDESDGTIQYPLLPDAKKEVIVNNSILTILNLSRSEAVGSEIELTFSVTSELLEDGNERIESIPAVYKIVGVISDDSAPYIYVPFADLKGLGIGKYSQLRIVTRNSDLLAEVREKIEAKGFSTSSVADTKQQIDSFFRNVNIFLALVGSFALAVACLGMFNTLTISLLERTREVGLLKTLGMRPDEVRILFLTESMIMGFYGGIFGLVLGSLASNLLSLALSTVAVARGAGFIDLSSTPFLLVVAVTILSFMVGFFTGLYPSNRSTSISALDALRYE